MSTAFSVLKPGGGMVHQRWTMPAAIVSVAVLSVVVASRTPLPSAAQGLGIVGFTAVALWMFLSERREWPCLVLALYLGCLDGYLKLSTGSSLVGLGRDVLLYAIVLGFLARTALRGEQLSLPPLAGWVIAYVAVVLLQLLNPSNAGIGHTIAAVRPHLEFLPLFFLGYSLVRTNQRLRAFFALLLVCAMANGVVSLVQQNLSPNQLAGWGVGYSKKVNGTGDVSQRVFFDQAGNKRVRPFGLGGDLGAGGAMGLVALGGTLALLSAPGRRGSRALTVVMSAGVPLAIITGQGRTIVVAAVVVLLTFVILATSAQRLVPTLAAVLLGIGVTFATLSYLADTSQHGVFDRYKSVAPSALSSTTGESRGGSLAKIPRFVAKYPFGAGIGFVGPAASGAGALVRPRDVDGETTPTFLLSDLGIPGLLVLFLFNVRLLAGSFGYIRRMEPEARILVSGVAAGVAGVFTMWVSQAPLAVSPTAPYFWFAAGALAYWLTNTAKVRRRAAVP